MPAGDLLPTSGDTYAAEIRAYLMADTADFKIRKVAGLGGNKIKTRFASLDANDGSVGSTSFLEDWPLLLTLQCNTGSPGTAELALMDLQTAWTAADEDVELHMWAPGWEHIKMIGQPIDLDPDRIFMPGGIIRAQATFQVLDAAVVSVP